MRYSAYSYLCLVLLLWSSCTDQEHESDDRDYLFQKIDLVKAGIDFRNDLVYTEESNVYTFRNFYNGAGVGLGDFNNDGLVDIFFCGNQVENKLYLNQGDFQFNDITDMAGVASKNVWSTGVSIVDINGDGWLDIYVCKSGDLEGENRHNELFINNGKSQNGLISFTESAELYGLDDIGLSTHAVFLDYDLDGDLDCYLLNNSFRSIGNYDLRPNQRELRDTLGGNKLFRNYLVEKGPKSQSNIFEDVSEEAGIYGSSIGFGLGVTFGDVNQDGWPDIYVSNDFFEKDYLYINNQDGTFDESVDEYMSELSMGSMGADMADVNNDGMQDIFVTEMLPRDEQRQKTKSLFEDWNKYSRGVNAGYHNQFARNVLQLNTGREAFKEVGRYAQVEATDWSWGALIFDMDNDGWKDLFVANGIYKDLLDQDYINFYSNPQEVKKILFDKEKGGLDKLVDMIPSEALSNFAFRNQEGFRYTDFSQDWGLVEKTFSNGSAYGDLDNDGDLDLVINNINDAPIIYKNSSQKDARSSFLQITLKDSTSHNSNCIGSAITIYQHGEIQHVEVNPARGFMSTVDARAHFGLKNLADIDSLIIRWSDRSYSRLVNVKTGQHITVVKGSSDEFIPVKTQNQSIQILNKRSDIKLIFEHRENEYSDFDKEPLLSQMHSNVGPACCVGDINGDGRTDFYVGGAKGQVGQLFVQNKQGSFVETSISWLNSNIDSEDTACLFFDANGDKKQDLYVASGSSEFGPNNSNLMDRLYLNQGGNNFEKSNQVLPTFNFENTSSLVPIDFDLDGDEDLVVSTFIRSYNYGVPSNIYLLQNDGKGNFENVTKELSPDFLNAGMISDLGLLDLDGDGDMDIVAVGEWTEICTYINDNGRFKKRKFKTIENISGLWNTLHISDIDKDGMDDIVLGNHGLNSRLRASVSQPLHLYINDFDQNGRVEQIMTYTNDNGEFPFAQRSDLLKQLPYLNKNYPNYNSYADQEIKDIFIEDQLTSSIRLEVNELRSIVLWNNGSGVFDVKALPESAQLTSIYAITSDDFNGDGIVDLLLGGNQTRMKPELGIQSASFGQMLLGLGGREYEAVDENESGVFEKGEIRGIESINISGDDNVLIVKNNGVPVIYEKNEIRK